MRVAFALATAAVVTIGAVHLVNDGSPTEPGSFDPKFFALLFTALIPSIIYAFGVRARQTVIVHGVVLVAVTTAAWAFVFTDDPMRAVGTILAFFVTLLTTVIAVMSDRGRGK